MGLLGKLLGRPWRELAARADSLRDEGELGLSLQEYLAAIERCDGDDADRSDLNGKASMVRSALRQKNLAAASVHAAAGEDAEVGYALDSAYEHSATDGERAEVDHVGGELERAAARGTPRSSTATIHYLATKKHTYTMKMFLESWGATLADQIDVISYEQLSSLATFPAGTYIFSDLERLTRAQRQLLTWLWGKLDESHVPTRLLNHPTKAKRRFDLLRSLHENGQNRFNLWRLDEVPRPLPGPVFVRLVNEHDGNLTGLIEDQAELDEAVARMLLFGIPPERLVVVQYIETADEEGLYRKYSAFRMGERVFPRHQIFGWSWVLKIPTLREEEHIEEEWRYLRAFPHELELRRIFDDARVDYGRIDYSLDRDGQIQVWEINTNPIVMFRPQDYVEAHLPAQKFFLATVLPALEALALSGVEEQSVEIGIDVAAARGALR